MAEYTVEISERELGVSFIAMCNNGKDDIIALHSVKRHSLGQQLGLSIGDQLVAINDKSVHHMSLSEMSAAFNSAQLPFTVTFSKFHDDKSDFDCIDSDDDDLSDDNSSDYNQGEQQQHHLVPDDLDEKFTLITDDEDSEQEIDFDEEEHDKLAQNTKQDDKQKPEQQDEEEDDYFDITCSPSFNSSLQISYRNLVTPPITPDLSNLRIDGYVSPISTIKYKDKSTVTPVESHKHFKDGVPCMEDVCFPDIDDSPDIKSKPQQSVLSKNHLKVTNIPSGLPVMDSLSISSVKSISDTNKKTLLSIKHLNAMTNLSTLSTLTLSSVNSISGSIEDEETKSENRAVLIDEYILSDPHKYGLDVHFDKCMINKVNDKVLILSTHGFNKGYHEWSVEILKSDIYQQEIGVVSVGDEEILSEMVLDTKSGVNGTKSLGARAIYGNELCTNTSYYASYNDNNKQRCYKDLQSKIGWCQGDIIRVCLDLEQWKMKFFLNDKRVRKAISLQPFKTYYPIISFAGYCQYGVVNILRSKKFAKSY